MQLLYNLIILFILFVVVTDLFTYFFLLKRTINRFVKPKLSAKRLEYVGYKWLYPVGRGDFRKLKIKPQKPKTRRQFKSLYCFIYYQDKGVAKRITIRIDILSYKINHILYSSEL